MISKQLIRLTLRKGWLPLRQGGNPVIPPTQIAWEDEKFVPPTDATKFWVRETLFTVNERLSGSDLLEFDGIYQLDIFAPKASGTKVKEDLAKSIGDLLAAGTSLTDPTIVYILRCETATAYDDEGWKVLPVRAVVKAYSTR